MRRRLVTVAGSISNLAMAEGLPVRFELPVNSVSLLGDSLAFVVSGAAFGEKNLLVFGHSGDEVARLGTTCGKGTIDQVLDIDYEIRVIESTPDGDYQARLCLDTLTLERVGEWK